MESLRPCFFFFERGSTIIPRELVFWLENPSIGRTPLGTVGTLCHPLRMLQCHAANEVISCWWPRLRNTGNVHSPCYGDSTHAKNPAVRGVFFWMVGFASFVGDHPPVFQNIVFLVDFLVDTCRVRLCKPPKIRGLTIANKRHTTVWKRWLVAVFHGRKNSITRQEALGTWRNKQCFVDFLGWAWPKKYPVNCLGYFRMVSGPLMSIHFETCWEMQSPHKWWGKASTNNYPPRNLT